MLWRLHIQNCLPLGPYILESLLAALCLILTRWTDGIQAALRVMLSPPHNIGERLLKTCTLGILVLDLRCRSTTELPTLSCIHLTLMKPVNNGRMSSATTTTLHSRSSAMIPSPNITPIFGAQIFKGSMLLELDTLYRSMVLKIWSGSASLEALHPLLPPLQLQQPQLVPALPEPLAVQRPLPLAAQRPLLLEPAVVPRLIGANAVVLAGPVAQFARLLIHVRFPTPITLNAYNCIGTSVEILEVEKR